MKGLIFTSEQRYLTFFSGSGPYYLLLGHSQAPAPQLSIIMWSEERALRTRPTIGTDLSHHGPK